MGTGCFRRSEAIEATEGISKSDGKVQVTGFSATRRFAASRRRRAETVVVGEVRRGLGVELGLQLGGSGCREPLWGSRIGGLSGLTDGVPRGLGSGSSGGTRIRGKGVL